MRDVHEVLLDGSEVGLNEADLERDDRVATCAMDGRPATRDGAARLMTDAWRDLRGSSRDREAECDSQEQAGDEQHPEDAGDDGEAKCGACGAELTGFMYRREFQGAISCYQVARPPL